MAPTALPMASTVPFDFARLEPTGGSLRAMVSLRNEIVKIADRVRAEHNSATIPTLPDESFRQFDALFELCWIGAIRREEKGNKPELAISMTRQRRRSVTKFAIKLAAGGLADIVLESEELSSIFQAILNHAAADGVMEIGEQAYLKASQEYRKRARRAKWYFERRHHIVFEAAFPPAGEPNLDGMLDLLTLLFNDAFVELVYACRKASDVYIILDSIDEYNGPSRAERRLRETFSSLLTDPALSACGIAMGSRKEPDLWIEEFKEDANTVNSILLPDLTKTNVQKAWRSIHADRERAQRALTKAFPGHRTKVRASVVAAAWDEAGAGG